MGRGSRHSKNAGTMGSESQTAGERAALGYGTVKERLGKEAIGNFYDCRITLKPAVDPVCTPDGYVFSRDALIENLAAQKKANKRKLAAWEEQQDDSRRKLAERAAVAEQTQLLAFDRQNHMGVSSASAASLSAAIREEAEALLADKRVVETDVAITQNKAKIKEMKAFWLPSQAPDTRTLLDKPTMDTLCPASGAKLRFKDLTILNFTRPPPGDLGDSSYAIDPVSQDTLTNSHQMIVLKATGDVMKLESYNTCVKPEGRYNDAKIREKDVIRLQRGGTGFAQHNAKDLQSTRFYHLGPGTGRQDLRGQHQGVRSAGGLVFNN